MKTSIVLILLILLAEPIFAAVMTSSNYSIQSDTVNFGGGFSTSTNYEQESTFGEIATGESESASYEIKAGYQQMQEIYLAIGAVADVALTPSIHAATGGTANGSTTA